MALQTTLELGSLHLTEGQRQRIDHHLASLERRLEHRPEPMAVLTFTPHPAQRQVEVSLRVQLGPLGAHLISHQSAGTADGAVRLAVEDVERQLERLTAGQRGEPSFGVPSRRPERPRRPRRPSDTDGAGGSR